METDHAKLTLEEKAHAGDAEAQMELAHDYYLGSAQRKQDFSQAMIWGLKAAEQGQPGAQLLVGQLLFDGLGVQKDPAAGKAWLQKAVDQNYTLALVAMADNESSKKNYPAAGELLRRAAENKDDLVGFVQTRLGLMYADGLGVRQDYDQAGDWFTKAAIHGNRYAKLLSVSCAKKRDTATAAPSTPYEFTKLFNSYMMQEIKEKTPDLAEKLKGHSPAYKTALEEGDATLHKDNEILRLFEEFLPASSPLSTLSLSAIKEKHLALYFLSDQVIPAQHVKEFKRSDGHIYISIVEKDDGREANSNVIKTASLLDGALKDGRGLSFCKESDVENPVWSISYGDLLCYKIFKSLRPQSGLDGEFHQDILSKPIPPGTKARVSRPSENILPQYARDVIGAEIERLLGRKVNWHFELIEYPSVDNLIRFVIKIEGMQRVPQSIGKALLWYLPYPVFG